MVNRPGIAGDRLHLSERGYEVWTEVIRGRLMKDLNTSAAN